MKLFKSKIFIFILIAAILLALVPTLIAAFGGTDLLRSTLGTVAKPFTMCASGVANAFNGFVNVFTQYDELKQENEQLKQEIADLKDREYNEKLLQEHNDWLNGYLNIHNQNPELNLAEARIISRESDNFSTVITLNKGNIHGIKKDMSILSERGLLGRVVEVGLDWCKAVTVLDASEKIGVYTEIGGVSGIIENNANLRKQGLCKMSYIDVNSNLQRDDRIYTEGGDKSIYPSGLLVGSIASIETDEITGEMIAVVTPAVDFSHLNSVSRVMIVLSSSKSGGNT